MSDEKPFEATYGGRQCGKTAAQMGYRVGLVEALCFTLGWEGGTVHQVAAVLGVPVREILAANEESAAYLLRAALRQRAMPAVPQPREITIKNLPFDGVIRLSEFKPGDTIVIRNDIGAEIKVKS